MKSGQPDKTGDQLRAEIASNASRRVAEGKTLRRLMREAKAHPEVSMTEAARLAGLRRRATAYDLAEE